MHHNRPVVLIIDPLFDVEPDIEQAVLGDGVELLIWRADGGASVPADLASRADVVINCRGRHKITPEVVARLTRAKMVVQAGVGFNHIDVAACAKAGIPVCNTPDYGTREVADHAIALMLTLIRGTEAYNTRLKQSTAGWNTSTLGLPAVRRMKGQVFGIVGLGRIGLATALRAKAFELDVVVHDPFLPAGSELAAGVRRVKTLEALLAQSDIVSLHCPLTTATANLIGDAAISAMKPGAVLINTARGPIVDLDAIERGLRSGHLRAAGLDVLPSEPPDMAHPLLAAWSRSEPWLEGRLIITPHAAFFTPESLADMRRLSALAAAEFLADGTLRALVNGRELAAAGHSV